MADICLCHNAPLSAVHPSRLLRDVPSLRNLPARHHGSRHQSKRHLGNDRFHRRHEWCMEDQKTWSTPPVPRPQNLQYLDLKLCSAAISTRLHISYRKATGRDSYTIALPAHKKFTASSGRVYPATCRAVVVQMGLECKTQGGGV
ncbi:hypothetical protein IG631_16169 [Alternaria alternata]|nr:hypothetical protein IG631_16169 [Alternaria alternata]